MKVLHHTGEPDIILPSEGTYPYVRGGVSSWIAQLISGLPQYNFGIAFIGSRTIDYSPTPLFEFPKNLVYVVEVFMFDADEKPPIQSLDGDPEAFKELEKLYQWFKASKGKKTFPQSIKSLDFYLNTLDESMFFYSREAWNFIVKKNQRNCSQVPFIDYFWTVRNIHLPVWKMAKLAKFIGNKGKIIHAPSTGYAGFLATLISHDQNKPFILTEHGIYTKERKIDLMSSATHLYNKLDLFTESGEENYIQNMWINFFEGLGKMSYAQANPILSLFGVEKETQIAYGAQAERCTVIPNGVDIHTLGATLKERPKGVPQVITLIGRVVSIKDIKTFIRAMRITVNALPDVEAWIVGPQDEEKAYAQECYELIDILDLKDKIKFLGFQKITDILPKSGLLTLTSISEGMPLVILEGYAAGVPCVGTDVGSCKELIYGGENPEDQALGIAGKVCQIANVEELASGYIEFLSDEKKWLSAQKVGLERVNRFYTQELFLKNYQSVYEDVFSQIESKEQN